MNIFMFHNDPIKSAICQPDKMLVKMVLETAQMLCTAHRELDGDRKANINGLYKTAYKNHPCTIWARESKENYQWLYDHFIALGQEYTYRYNKVHTSITKLQDALQICPKNIVQDKMTKPAQAMPVEYKHKNVTVAYRRYCIAEKHYAKWQQGRCKPNWWK